MSIREGLLALLAAGPKHGYQLKGEFEHVTAGVWPLNIGQVYTTLERLERDGLVAADHESTEQRRPYSITALGRDELIDWFSAAGGDKPDRDPLIIKVLVALHTAGVNTTAVLDTQRSALLATLQEQRRAQRKALMHNEPSTVAALTSVLLFDALIARSESELRWLDLCEERLRQLPQTSPTSPTSPTDRKAS
jgi:DNA-binding PadR family transcriptional regulator